MEKGFQTYLRAGYPVLWVQTHEECRAISTLAREAAGYKVYSWDLMSGMKEHLTGKTNPLPDPVKAINFLNSCPDDTVLFLKDFHKFINAIEVFRSLKNIIPALKESQKHIVIVSPVCAIPVELEKEIQLYTFSLPTLEELVKLAKKISAEYKIESLDEEAVSAAKGLTLSEAEDAFSRSLVVEKRISKKIVQEDKLQVIKKSGMMELFEPIPIDQMGGCKRLIKYVFNRKRGFGNPAMPNPNGILLVGPPGTGKTLTAKIIASVFDVPLIRLDLTSLKEGIVGASERKMRDALSMIDAIGKCVVLIDEIEKSIGGVQSSNKTDGGVTAGMFGYLLTWMQESKTPHYIVATCNEIQDLLAISQGALLRRFDDIFFVDLPTVSERKEILAIMNARYKTNLNSDLCERMEHYTGAEIEKLCKASVYDGIEDAFQNVKPLFIQNQEIIEKARQWASFNARFANEEPTTIQPEKRRVK